jgi:gliding motility-associated-like protein
MSYQLFNSSNEVVSVSERKDNAVVFIFQAPEATGEFRLTAITENCESDFSEPFTITVQPVSAQPVISIFPEDQPLVCTGDDAFLQAPEAAEYQWYRNEELLPDQTGREIRFSEEGQSAGYSLRIRETANSCLSEKSETVSIEVRSNPDPPQVVRDTVICEGENLNLPIRIALSGIEYQLLNESGALVAVSENASNGTIIPVTDLSGDQEFRMVAVDQNTGCESDLSDPVRVAVRSQSTRPVIESNGISGLVCSADGIYLEGPEAAKYYWYLDEILLNDQEKRRIKLSDPDQSGSYQLQVEETTESCRSDFSEAFEVEVVATPDRPVVQDTGRCGPGKLELTADGGQEGDFRWYNEQGQISGETGSSFTTPEIDQSTTYSVVIENQGCRSAMVEVQAEIYPAPQANAGEDQLIKKGNPITLSASGGSSYQWEPENSLQFANTANPIAEPQKTTNYQVTVTTEDGCEDEDEVTITVKDQIVFVPDGFSPNNDGLNDTWNIINIERFPDCEVYIFNRWGNLIFYSEGYQQAWDGTITGSSKISDTYLYKIILNQEEEPLHGSLTIIQ